MKQIRSIVVLLMVCVVAFGKNSINNESRMAKKALVIIDIQNDYFEGGANALKGSEDASLNAKRVMEEFRKEGLPIVHVQHVSVRKEATFFIPETRGVEIHKNVTPLAGEKVVVKYFPNSFRQTDLLEYLQSNEVTELVVCGMMTHMCVDATVRAAKDFGFTCTLIGDACATRDLEINGQQVEAQQVHNAFLAALNYFYATVMDAESFLSMER